MSNNKLHHTCTSFFLGGQKMKPAIFLFLIENLRVTLLNKATKVNKNGKKNLSFANHSKIKRHLIDIFHCICSKCIILKLVRLIDPLNISFV